MTVELRVSSPCPADELSPPALLPAALMQKTVNMQQSEKAPPPWDKKPELGPVNKDEAASVTTFAFLIQSAHPDTHFSPLLLFL